MANHGVDEPNPPSPVDPRLLEDDELKRLFRVSIQDISDGRIGFDEERQRVDKDGLRLIAVATEAERELRRRDIDVEELIAEDLSSDN